MAGLVSFLHREAAMPYHVYVLASETTGETYVGQTQDLARRLREHNDPDCQGTLHTKRHAGPWRLLYAEPCPTRSAAMRREKQLKSAGGRRYIRELVEERNGPDESPSAGGC